MVHRDIGSARITYPTGVKVSPADPMTSANLPRELRLVPGVVSRPIRLSGPGQRNARQLIAHYLREARGDAVQAAALANRDRLSDPRNVALRNAEHALFSRSVLQSLGPVLGRAVVATSVPLYSGAKAIGRPMGFFKTATAPSWQEVQYGLEPIVTPAPAPEPVVPPPPTITSYVTEGVWPGAMVATAEQCQAYLSTHGGTGSCRAVYADGTMGPLIPYSAPVPATGLGYYPNLGQDASTWQSYMPTLSDTPTWVWWAGAGLVAVLVAGVVFRGRRAPARPRVRTVTRTTF